ncbi:WXG100 family type VII secretion target [Prauserella oleivorans]|uniref:WXG100 family type VII secretion target n=1 Tax=Prauserella oleivorans TaxID=1478153 RepID=A0ABW5WJ75_9PSEU
MPDFTVDIGGLDALGKNLDRTVENIENATKRLEDAGPDSIGPETLDEACADFRSDWEEGLEKLRDAVSEIREGLDKAKTAYAEAEAALQDSLAKMAGDLEAAGVAKS